MHIPTLKFRALRPAAAAALLLLAALTAACGKKGPVLPKLAALPAAPGEAAISQQGDDFLVSWRIPETNEDGSRAEDLRGFHIYRLVYPAAEGCPTCRDPEELIAAVELNRPEPAQRLGKRLYWRDPLVAPGTGHAYLIVPVTVGGHEGAGTGIYRTWELPPPAPVGVRAEADGDRIQLTWSPPALPGGQELLGYNLYRRTGAEPFPPIPLNAEPLAATRLTDAAVPAGRTAGYRLTTVARSAGQVVESAPADEVTATPAGPR